MASCVPAEEPSKRAAKTTIGPILGGRRTPLSTCAPFGRPCSLHPSILMVSKNSVKKFDGQASRRRISPPILPSNFVLVPCAEVQRLLLCTTILTVLTTAAGRLVSCDSRGRISLRMRKQWTARCFVHADGTLARFWLVAINPSGCLGAGTISDAGVNPLEGETLYERQVNRRRGWRWFHRRTSGGAAAGAGLRTDSQRRRQTA